MNFKVNLFFHLYETPFNPLDIPTPIFLRVSGGMGLGGHNGKNKFAPKYFAGKIKHFKATFVFLMEKLVIEDPPNELNGKFH